MAIVGARVRRINRVCFQSLFTMSLNVTTTDRGENRDCLKALKDYSSHFKGKMHQLKQVKRDIPNQSSWSNKKQPKRVNIAVTGQSCAEFLTYFSAPLTAQLLLGKHCKGFFVTHVEY